MPPSVLFASWHTPAVGLILLDRKSLNKSVSPPHLPPVDAELLDAELLDAHT